MSFHWFAITALHPEAAQQELNAFLADCRVLSVQRAFVPDGAASYWSLCVEVGDGRVPRPAVLHATRPFARGGRCRRSRAVGAA